MQPELPKFDFASQAEIWSEAEYRRSEEISGWVKQFFRGWAAMLGRRWQSISDVAQYAAASARTGEHRRS